MDTQLATQLDGDQMPKKSVKSVNMDYYLNPFCTLW